MQRKRIFLVSMVLILMFGFYTTFQSSEQGVSYAQDEILLGHIEADQSSSLLASLSNPYQIADIADAANPATVYISVKWPVEEQAPEFRRNDPFSFFYDFFMFPQPYPSQPNEQISQGSGFIIDQSGIVLTNQHVVGDLGEKQEITVTINSLEISGDFKATILGSDERLDLAVLQIEDSQGPFPTIALGDSDTSRPGEWVIAIGNPYGRQFDHTVTVGVLSATGREIQIRNNDGTIQGYKNLMQTDAAINSGNSGGPLLNIEGEVIGINTAVHAQAQGIGFAIPINIAKDVLDELIETGGVALPPLPWLGIYYQEVDETVRGQLRLPDTKGVVILDLVSDSPASEAGLRPRDIIRRIDDFDIHTTDNVSEVISQYKPGDEIVITVFREGQTRLISVKLGDTPEEMRD